MSGIIGWIVSKIKWLLLIAAVGGPVIAYLGWDDMARRGDIAKRGIETNASVDGATRTRRKRGGISYTVNLKWQDSAGKMRSAEKVSISNEYAGRIIRGDSLIVAQTKVKYLSDATNDKDSVMIVDDTGKQDDLDSSMVYAGIGAGIIGMVGSGLFFFLGRRRRDDVEASA